MRCRPRLSSSMPETRTSRPLTLASCTVSSERSASSRRKLSRRDISGLCLDVLGQRVHAGIQTLLTADIGFGLSRHHPALAQGQLLVGHQAPGSGTLGCQLPDAGAFLGVEQNAHVFLIIRHGRQRLFGEGQQLCRMQRQLAADHLLGDLLHQLQKLLPPGLLEILTEPLEAFDQLIQRLRSLFECLQALDTPLFAADGLAVFDTALETFAMAGFTALLQALFVALVDTFLKALGNSTLQRSRIAGQHPVALRRRPDPRRKTERAPGTAFTLDDLDAHRRLLDRLFAEQLSLQVAV